jgi:hypothetical protein
VPNKFEMASSALVMVGSNPITSFEGIGSAEIVAANLYEPTVRELLGLYRWRFATVDDQLTRMEGAPKGRYSASYLLPADTLQLQAVQIRGCNIEFDRFNDYVRCDAGADDTVIATRTVRVGEAFWPGYFEALVRTKLAAAFAIQVADDGEKAAIYEGKALRLFAAAKNIDAQGRTARKMPAGRLRRVHGGRP